jgi:hypothetical protein
MIIKCSECGIEYSYGRNICHKCDNKTIFFGSLLHQYRSYHNWNCEDSHVCLETPLTQIRGVQHIIDDNKNNEIILIETLHHKWNCSEELQLSDNELKRPSCLYMYE